jgi:primosomal replication protein N''
MWKKRRRKVCVQIVDIEAELRGYNEALWTSKSCGGISYREILARLVALRTEPTLLAANAELRPLLSKLTYQQVQDIKERIAKIAPVWQSADLAKNLWRYTKSFDFSDETNREISTLLAGIQEVVALRDEHVSQFGELIPNAPANDLRLWLDDYGNSFSELSDALPLAWVTWWREFVISLPAAHFAPEFLHRLGAIVTQLKPLREAEPEIAWTARFAALDAAQLRVLRNHCEAFVQREQSWFRKLIPLRKAARTELARHAHELNEPYKPPFVSRLLQHCQHILQLHDAVAELRGLLAPLGVDPWQWKLSAEAIYQQAAIYLEILQRAERVRVAIEQCPLKLRLLDTLKEDSLPAVRSLIEKLRQSCVRSELDDRVRSAVAPLHEYLDDEFRAAIERQLVQQRPLGPGIAGLVEKLHTVPAIQKFRFFRSRLPDSAGSVFDVLANASDEKRTDGGGIARLWANSMEIAALTAWKKELETAYPQLVQIPSDYYHSQVRKLQQLETEKKNLDRAFVFERQHNQSVARDASWRNILVTHGKGSKRLRQVVSMGAPHGIFNLRPVWLTNPETVSQIFPLKSGLFDIVIFDEASQLPPEFAVGSLFRAKRAVVSGDEHQLPPTSFFQAGVDLTSDSEIEKRLEELETRLEDEGDDPELVKEYERVQNMVQSICRKSSDDVQTDSAAQLVDDSLSVAVRGAHSVFELSVLREQTTDADGTSTREPKRSTADPGTPCGLAIHLRSNQPGRGKRGCRLPARAVDEA